METLKQGLCSPVIIAALLTAISVFMGVANKSHDPTTAPRGSPAMRLLGSLFFLGILWTLCYYGYTGAAWFFVLLPFVAILVEMAMVMGAMSAIANGEAPPSPPPS